MQKKASPVPFKNASLFVKKFRQGSCKNIELGSDFKKPKIENSKFTKKKSGKISFIPNPEEELPRTSNLMNKTKL